MKGNNKICLRGGESISYDRDLRDMNTWTHPTSKTCSHFLVFLPEYMPRCRGCLGKRLHLILQNSTIQMERLP